MVWPYVSKDEASNLLNIFQQLRPTPSLPARHPLPLDRQKLP